MLPIRKTVSALVSTAMVSALATTAVMTTAAAPARALETPTITIEFEQPRPGVFGEFLDLSGGSITATFADGTTSTPPEEAGTAILQRQLPGATTWTDVESDTTVGFLLFQKDSEYTRNVKYRVFYTGGTSGEDTYPQTISDIVRVKTRLDTDVVGQNRKRGLFAVFSVLPKAKFKVTVQIKRNGKFRPYAKTTTNRRGKADVRITETSFKGVRYRAIFAGGQRFTTTVLPFVGTRGF